MRPYRGYTAVNMIEFGAESEYHGLQTRLTRRFGQRFTANVGYTLSKALDHVDTDNNAIGYYVRPRSRVGAVRARSPSSAHDRLRLRAAGRGDEVVQQRVRPGPAQWLADRRHQPVLERPAAHHHVERQPRHDGRRRARGLPRRRPVSRRADARCSGSTRWRSGVPRTARSARRRRDFSADRGSTSGTSRSTRTRASASRVNVQFRLETFNTFNHVQFNGINTGVNVPNAGQAVTAATRGHARAGHELPRSAPDPGGVEALFLERVRPELEPGVMVLMRRPGSCGSRFSRRWPSPLVIGVASAADTAVAARSAGVCSARASVRAARLAGRRFQHGGRLRAGQGRAGASDHGGRVRRRCAGRLRGSDGRVRSRRRSGIDRLAGEEHASSTRRRAASRLVDIDNDGWLDVYLVNGSTRCSLQRRRARAARPRSSATIATSRSPTSPIAPASRTNGGASAWRQATSTTTAGPTSTSQSRGQPPLSQQPRRHVHRRRRAHGRHGAGLVDRRELRRLRWRRPARSVRRRLRGHRSGHRPPASAALHSIAASR